MDYNYFLPHSYPNQVIRYIYRNKIFIRRETAPTTCYVEDTIVGTMEVLKRRDKTNERCVSDWHNHDNHVLEAIIKNAGCAPKHWNIESDMGNCTTHKQHHAIYNKYNHLRELIPNCRGIEKLTQTSFETDFGINCTFTGSWRLMINIDIHKEAEYKDALLVRTMSFQSENYGKY